MVMYYCIILYYIVLYCLIMTYMDNYIFLLTLSSDLWSGVKLLRNKLMLCISSGAKNLAKN